MLGRNWPPRVLLLSEVVVPSGAHHLILVVRTKEADLVSIISMPTSGPWLICIVSIGGSGSRRRKTRCSGRASGGRTSYARQVWPINSAGPPSIFRLAARN